MPGIDWDTIQTGIVGVGTVVGTIVVARASRRSRQQERRDDFTVLQAELRQQKAHAERQNTELRTEVQHVRVEVAEERAGRAEDRRLCEEERRQSQRKIDALLRFLWSMARVMQVHDVQVPALPPRDKTTLEEYDLPGV